MAQTVLLSTLLMGLFLLVILVSISRLRQWHQAPSTPGGFELFDRAARNETTWTVLFVLVTLVFAAGAVAVVGDSVSLSAGDSFWGLFGLVFVPFLIMLAILLFGGVYAAARARGMASSYAAGLSSGVLGLLLIATVTIRLAVGG